MSCFFLFFFKKWPLTVINTGENDDYYPIDTGN